VLVLSIKLENERTLNMEKAKYIVKGLGAVLAGVGLMLALGYGLVAIGKLLGLEAEHVTGGVVVLIALGMMVFWLSEDYELKKLKNK
tara:strand:+ start:137 stop:397 length:261 start_codon:yes stop_codon:yes gene_type:complete